jgi:DHA1 family tetracycline resistance protein-like MFS transporter
LRSSPLLPIFLIVAVDVLGLTIMIPLLPFYAEKLGASAMEVGLLISAYAVCQLFSGPLLGKLSDRTGRKPLLLVSQAGTFIGFIITAFAPTLGILVLARCIDGATAGNLSLAQAYISDISKPEERSKSFGVIGVAFGLGFLIGPAISGFLASYDYRYPIFAAAALSACSIAATYFLLPSAKPVLKSRGSSKRGLFDWGAYADYFHQPKLAPLLYEFLAFAFSFAMFTTGLPLFCQRRLTWNGGEFGATQVGYTWALAGLIGIVLQGWALGKLVKRFGESPLKKIGFAGYAVGYAILAFCHSISMLLVGIVVLSIGGLVRPTLTSLITQASRAEEQGVVLGLTQSLTSISQIAGPALTGFLIQRDEVTGWGLTVSAVALIGLLLAAASGSQSLGRQPIRT